MNAINIAYFNGRETVFDKSRNGHLPKKRLEEHSAIYKENSNKEVVLLG